MSSKIQNDIMTGYFSDNDLVRKSYDGTVATSKAKYCYCG